MPYVYRSTGGPITGLYSHPLKDLPEEFLPDDNPEVVSFRNPPPPILDEVYDNTLQNQQLLKALVLCLNDGSIVPGANVSNAALKAAIKAKM